MKKKIFIILNHLLYIKHYIYTDAFKELENKYDCYYILENSLKDQEIKNILGINSYNNFKKKVILNFEYNKLQKKLFSFLFDKIQMRHRNNFSNIKYNTDNDIKLKKIFYAYENPSIILGIKRIILWQIKIFRRILIFLFFHKIFDRILNKLISVNKKLLDLFKNEKPHLVIIPFNGSHISIFDTIRYFNKIDQKRVLMVSENWDNLFSRYMVNQPDFMTVWGEQVKKPLKRQKFKGKVFTIGTPRLDSYFVNREKKVKSPFKFKYAVFFDRADPRFRENEIILKNVDDFLEKNKNKFKNFKLVFRPHPYTRLQDLELINFNNYKNIILDPQMKSRYTFNNEDSKTMSGDFEYSSKLIKNAEFVISSTSSVTIEASIFYKKVIVITPENDSTKKRLIDVWEQFQEVTKFPNIKICEGPHKLVPLIKQFIYNKKRITNKEIDKCRNRVLFSDGKKFSSRISNKVSYILN